MIGYTPNSGRTPQRGVDALAGDGSHAAANRVRCRVPPRTVHDGGTVQTQEREPEDWLQVDSASRRAWQRRSQRSQSRTASLPTPDRQSPGNTALSNAQSAPELGTRKDPGLSATEASGD